MSTIPSQAEQDARWFQWQTKNRARDAESAATRSRNLKVATIAVLVFALMFWPSVSEYHLLFRALVSFAALLAALRAYAIGDTVWIGLFALVVAAWNPIAPIFQMTGPVAIAAVIATAVLFTVSAAIRRRLIAPVRWGTR